jgi:hypothetical protein
MINKIFKEDDSFGLFVYWDGKEDWETEVRFLESKKKKEILDNGTWIPPFQHLDSAINII